MTYHLALTTNVLCVDVFLLFEVEGSVKSAMLTMRIRPTQILNKIPKIVQFLMDAAFKQYFTSSHVISLLLLHHPLCRMSSSFLPSLSQFSKYMFPGPDPAASYLGLPPSQASSLST